MPREYSWSKSELTLRATLPMTEQMHQGLRDLAIRCKKAGGRTMAQSELLRALVRWLLEVAKDLPLEGVKSEDELVDVLLASTKKRKS